VLQQQDCTKLAVELDLDSKEPGQLAAVGDFEDLLDAFLELLHVCGCGHDKQHVIHVHKDDGDFAVGVTADEHSVVVLAAYELNAAEGATQLHVPATSGLLEAVDGQDEMEDLTALHASKQDTCWQHHVDCLVVLELAIQVGRLDIELVNKRAVMSSHAEERAGASHLDNWCKGVVGVAVDAVLLREFSSNNASTVADDVAVCVALGPEDPFACDDADVDARMIGVDPSAAGLEPVDFFGHSLLPLWPIWAAHGFNNCAWIAQHVSSGRSECVQDLVQWDAVGHGSKDQLRDSRQLESLRECGANALLNGKDLARWCVFA
jgi:hypothetical protein